MYYEIHGPMGHLPLVLLHGGGDTIETSFGRLLPVLARSRRIIAFEQQGCGRTAISKIGRSPSSSRPRIGLRC
jgi:pimeloyl-ACP methyl ester carboxylesterase